MAEVKVVGDLLVIPAHDKISCFSSQEDEAEGKAAHSSKDLITKQRELINSFPTSFH